MGTVAISIVVATVFWKIGVLLERVNTDDDQQAPRTIGSLLLRFIYHYWYHTGETMAIRQMLGHKNLPEFVGNLEAEAPYLPY